MSSLNEAVVDKKPVPSDKIQNSNKCVHAIHEACEEGPPEKATKKPKYPLPISIVDLFLLDIKPITYFVETLVPQGLAILAGVPKTGKSFLCLMIALAVGSGRTLFNSLETRKSNVLILSLEDGLQIIKNRISKMVTVSELTSGIHIRTQWGSSFDMNLKFLDSFLCQNKNVGLVIIDTITLFCGSSKRGTFKSEYSVANRIKALADEHGVAILATHHTVKKVGNDWLSSLYGSHGVVAAADAILFLDRQRDANTAELKITGRNVETNTYALKFDSDSCVWELENHGYEIDLQPERLEILKVLQAYNQPMKLSEIAKAVCKSVTNVQNLLKKLMKIDLVIKTAHGVYALAPGVNSSELMEPVEAVDSVETNTSYTIDPVDLTNPVELVDFRYLWS
jgi:predicted transcriptional regulator